MDKSDETAKPEPSHEPNFLRLTRVRGVRLYGLFEQAVGIIIGVFIVLAIIVALYNLVADVIELALAGTLVQNDQSLFLTIFGNIITIIIALEFNHTVYYSLINKSHIFKAKTILLISILAIARKFIIIDVEKLSPLVIVSYAIAILFLGIVYYVMDREDHVRAGRP
jgi:uncharacterized membrane protein (DUF373 family)